MDTSRYAEFIREVRAVGDTAKEAFFKGTFGEHSKEDGTPVTDIDERVEEQLRNAVVAWFPGDTVIGEEGGEQIGSSGFVWHIDPIDGTDNFARRIPFFALSLARLGPTDRESFSVVLNPVTGQSFHAVGGLAYADDLKVALGDSPVSKARLITIGRGSRDPEKRAADYDIRKRLGTHFGKCWPLGCAALELSYAGLGRIDGFLSLGLATWDIAAGLLIARCAGASVSEYVHGAWSRYEQPTQTICKASRPSLLVSRESLHEEIIEHAGDVQAALY